jgi:tetratricopeptide (TPR) repeat protein
MNFQKFISELVRRNVFKAGIAYLAIAWVIIQIASIIFPAFDATDHALKILIYIFSFGLVLWIIFSWFYDLTPEGFRKTEDIENSEEVTKLNSKRLNKIIAISLFMAVILLITASFWAGLLWNEGILKFDSKKVAVIPFTLNTEIQDDYFKVGFTDALIEELSKVDQLKVIHQESSKRFTSPLSTANLLVSNEINTIDYFVEGTLNKDSNTLSANITLKEELGSEPIWAKSYSDDITNIKKLWAQVAIDLSERMGIKVKQEDLKLFANIKPIKPETYELYLKGKHQLIQNTEIEWQKGLVYLEEAINLNPNDSYAHSGLAEGYIMLAHGPSPPSGVITKAHKAAQRAIQLDSTNAQGWAALAHYHTYFGQDWELAEYAFNKADELNPNMAYNHYHRAWFLALFGRMNEAIYEHKLAQELDPFTPLHTVWLGELYRMVGLYEEGLVEVEKVNDMESGYALGKLIKGRILMYQGNTDEGLELIKQASLINPGFKYYGYGQALIRAGKIEESKAIIKELESLPPTGFGALCLGIMYSDLGEIDKALEWLSFKEKHAWYAVIRIRRTNKAMLENTRFLELIRNMNLPDPAPLIYTPN